ncbi:hypothetical protein [Silvibacterium sp.]|uniref:hypothetical protein n=1 Tax=Silvibacterium sp. TaxID=1964179 RepID=UPI0039E31231
MVRVQRHFCAAGALVLGLGLTGVPQAKAQHFLPDDPLRDVPEVAAVGKTTAQSINQLYDFAVNSGQYKPPKVMGPSLGVNTLGEVPDSSWYTNRDLSAITPEEIRKGSRTHGLPQPPFTVVAAKTEGVTPGFRIRDGRGLLYFVKVDPATNPEMASTADVVGALLLYAAGYNVPENYILTAPRSAFVLSKTAKITAASGKAHPMTKSDLNHILDVVPVERDGQIRVMASLALEGKIVGPFRYKSTRPDDPNDLIPHEQRRDLRGLDVVFAWLNHTDAKGDNSLDTVIGKGDEARFRHNLLDFGDSFGSDSDIAKDPRHGQEYFLPTSGEQWKRGYSLGLAAQPWERVHYPGELKSIGNFTAVAFDPLTWKPNYPNPAFLQMTPLDAYWGAKKVMAFTNAQIEAAAAEAQFSDPQATAYMAKVLEQRRDAIGRAWFSRVLPLEGFTLQDGTLHYQDLGATYGFWPQQHYRTAWFRFDNQTGQESILSSEGDAAPSELANLAEGSFIGCRLKTEKNDERSTTVYFRRDAGAWTVVGITRTALHL